MVHEEEELASAQHGAAFPHRHRATHPIGHSALGDPPAVDEDSQPRSTDSIAGIGRHALHQGDVHRQVSAGSSELAVAERHPGNDHLAWFDPCARRYGIEPLRGAGAKSEEHTSELQSLMRISYAVFCLKNKKPHTLNTINTN